MGFFDDLEEFWESPIRSTVRMSARMVSVALGIPIALAQEAIDARCETYEEIRDYIREHHK